MAATAAAVAAIVVGVSKYIGAKSANKARKKRIKRLKYAESLVSPEGIVGATKELQPQFRQQIFSGSGQAFRQTIDRNIARSGLRNTGVGTALRNAGTLVPEIEAFKLALDRAVQVRTLQAESIYRSIGLSGERANPYSEALAGAASAYAGAAGSEGFGSLFPSKTASTGASTSLSSTKPSGLSTTNAWWNPSYGDAP